MQTIKNQENSENHVGENYLTNRLLKFLHDYIKPWRVGALRVSTGRHYCFTSSCDMLTMSIRLIVIENFLYKQHFYILLVFENYSHSSSTLASKNNKTYPKKYVCIHEIIRLIIMKMKMEMKNRSHRYDIDLHLDMDTNIVNIKIISV